MSFLAPLWLAAAAVAALGVVVLHLITTQRPQPVLFPTARFVPAGEARASSRAARPTDLLLLLLRCLALLLLGTAFAGPVTRASGSSLVRVIVVDRSRAAQPDVRDSALALARSGDAVVFFDSTAAIVTSGAGDSLRAMVPGRSRGSLSAALVGARRAARDLARTADSVELAIVSPLTADEIDAASSAMAGQWPGRTRLVRTAPPKAAGVTVTLQSVDADDVLRPAIATLNAAGARGENATPVRVVRGTLSPSDSSAARDGATVISWPRIDGATASAQGVWAGNATFVAPLARLALPSSGRTVARWADGAPAAVEATLGRGCVRAVGAGIPDAGDIALQPAFIAVARELVAACDASGAAIPDSVATRFSRAGPAAGAAALRATDERSPLTPWLLGAALLLLVGEQVVRRGAVETP